MKIIVTIIRTNVVTNSLLSFKQKSNFKQAVGRSANGKYFCFLFITSCALFQSHGEFSKLL